MDDFFYNSECSSVNPATIWQGVLEYTTLHSPNIPVQIYIYLPTTFWLKALSLCAHESTKVSDYIAVHLQVMFWWERERECVLPPFVHAAC